MSNERIVNGVNVKVSNFKQLKFAKHNEEARAVASKLIHAKDNGSLNSQAKLIPDDSVLTRIVDHTTANIEDSANIFQVLPDVKAAMDIWVSCIISPKDFTTKSLFWQINDYRGYNAKLFNELLQHTKNYFENDYGIIEMLEPAIEDALFKTGSYPLIVIPESTIDDIINGRSAISNESLSVESYLQPMGLLGNRKGRPKISTEAHQLRGAPKHALENLIHDNLQIYDNTDVLRLSALTKVIRKQTVRKQIRSNFNYSIESVKLEDSNTKDTRTIGKDDTGNTQVMDTKNRDAISQQLYKNPEYQKQKVVQFQSAKTASRLPIGHPLVMKVPSSSVIPVHVPGDPTDLIGVFILLDENGNPVNTKDAAEQYSAVKDASMKELQNKVGGVLKQMQQYGNGTPYTLSDMDNFDSMAKTYGSLLEQDLIERLSEGVYKENVEIAHSQEIYRMMLNRALNRMNTKILYCPSELITYFAFDYNKYGIGKSLLTDLQMLSALRAAILNSSIFNEIQNNIGRRRLNITLGENDIQPEKTIETLILEYNRVNSFSVPLLDSSPTDAINLLREKNIDIVIDGANKIVPETQFGVEDVKSDRHVPDNEFEEKLRNLYMAGLGLPATVVDETQESQFASTNVNANILFNRRVMNYQRIVSNGLLWDFVNKYTLASGTLIKELSLIIKDHKDLLTEEQRASGETIEIIENFLESISITLPSPDMMKVEDQQKDFDAYKSFLENVIDALLPDSVIDKIKPKELADQDVDFDYREILKSQLLTQYVKQTGILPEIFSHVEQDEDEDVDGVLNSSLEQGLAFAKAMTATIFAYDQVSKTANDRNLKKVMPSDDDEMSSTDDSSSDDSGSDDDFGGGDAGGGDDGGMDEFDMDFGGDEGGVEAEE